MVRLGILGSTRGSHLDAIVSAIKEQQLAVSIEVILSNKSDALILKRAKAFGFTAKFIDSQGLTREEYDAQLSIQLKQHAVDWILLIGFMRILSPVFINDWKNKIINIHPSLLPAHAGKMDLAIHHDVLAAKEEIAGCTVHYVTEILDGGPIILQKQCEVLVGDTVESLKERIQHLEKQALIEVISGLSQKGR
jgi:phosphoribosylglycinamide formyltransferase-1